jgi:hypothetical protein
MYVPAPPAQPAAVLAAVGVDSTALGLDTPFAAPPSTTLRVHRAILNLLTGQPVKIDGTLTLAGGDALASRTTVLGGLMVSLQALGRRGWHTIAHVRSGPTGRFALRYVPRRTGSERVRVRFAGDASERGAERVIGRLSVYRLAEASWYGGGGSLACGGELTSTTMGVANKTLACGTLVTLRYDGRSVRVPVIDRGPYVAGREFDLTEATKEALGFGSTGEVWSTS